MFYLVGSLVSNMAIFFTAILLMSISALAIDPAPGAACAVAGARTFSGGPELSGFGHWLVCSGGFWEASLSSTGAGLLAVGTTTVGTGVRVEIAGGALRLSQQTASLAGEIQFAELLAQGTNTVALRAPGTLAASLTWVLPSSSGASGEQLTLGSGGTTYWGSASGGGVAYPLLATTLGSVGTPVFSFSADSDTGIFSPGTGTLAFATNGTNRVNINSLGNVGIGTTNPTTKFEINGSGVAGPDGISRITATAGDPSNGPFSLVLGDDAQDNLNYRGFRFGLTNQGHGFMYSYIAGITKDLFINPVGGSVGVGTTSPAALFDVAGSARSTSQILAGGGTLTMLPPLSGVTVVRFPSNTGTAGQVLSTDGTASLSWITPSGSIAFPILGSTGTGAAPTYSFAASPGTGMHYNGVNGIAFSAGGVDRVSLTNSAMFGVGPSSWSLAYSNTAVAPPFSSNVDSDTGIYFPGVGTLAISTNGTNRVNVDSNGNVGIGTTTPQSKLHVNGDIKVGNSAIACDATAEGNFRYNASIKGMEFCEGANWYPMALAPITIRAEKSATQAIVQNTGTMVTFQTVVHSTNLSITAGTEFIAPAGGAGVYTIAAGLKYTAQTSGYNLLAVSVNNTTVVSTQLNPTNTSELNVGTQVRLLAGDTVRVHVFISGVGGGTINNVRNTHFAMTRIAP